jgi:quercetin dioxygenase-like cupin family protein
MEIMVERPKPGVTLETLHRGAVFKVVRVSVAAGISIPPHPEDYTVLFYVLEGSGRITSNECVKEVRAGDHVLVGHGATRGIEAHENMILLGIQEPH